jgi:hypothetical protein
MSNFEVDDDSSVASEEIIINTHAKSAAAKNKKKPTAADKAPAKSKKPAPADEPAAKKTKAKAKPKPKPKADTAPAPAPVPVPAPAPVAQADEPKPKQQQQKKTKSKPASTLARRKELAAERKAAALALVKDSGAEGTISGSRRGRGNRKTPAQRHKQALRHGKVMAKNIRKVWRRTLARDGATLALPKKVTRTLFDSACMDYGGEKRRCSKEGKTTLANYIGLLCDRLVARAKRSMEASGRRQMNKFHVMDAAHALNLIGDGETYVYNGQTYAAPVIVDHYRDNGLSVRAHKRADPATH